MMEKNTTAGEQETSSAATEAPEQPPYPFLLPPPLNPEGFTAFLDLDGILINASEEKPDKFDYVITAMIAGKPTTYYIQKRPFVDDLLDYLGERFEVVLFTAGPKEYASPIVDQLDTKKVICHRLYRDSCKLRHDGRFVKDLSLTGRDLSKVLIVDQYSFSLQPENRIHIWPFSGNLEDKDLRNLIDHVLSRSQELCRFKRCYYGFRPFWMAHNRLGFIQEFIPFTTCNCNYQ